MISLLQRKSLTFLHPILKRLVNHYLRKPRPYRFQEIQLIIYPSVFHPGLFYSTKFLIRFLEKEELKNQSVLELGAGSGLISLFCVKKGANVTATDINKQAIQALRENASKNNCTLEIFESDLFEKVNPEQFELIVINPPYYPKTPRSDSQAAWYCGENHEYFQRLFTQWEESTSNARMLMVLSEDCELDQIRQICEGHNNEMNEVDRESIGGELNYIFEIKKS